MPHVTSWFFVLNWIGIFSFSLVSSLWFLLGLSRSSSTQEKHDIKKSSKKEIQRPIKMNCEIKIKIKICVIMPSKGIHSQLKFFQSHHVHANQSKRKISCNGNNQAALSDLEFQFVFVVQDANDSSLSIINQIIAENQSRNSQTETRERQDISVKIAGRCYHSSQKLHNLIEASKLSSNDCKYLLFLDNDVLLYPNAIMTLVDSLEENEDAFCASGYPLDLIEPGSANIGAYSLFLYRLVNLIAFAKEKNGFSWGGCVLLRRDDFVNNSYNLIDCYRDGGYSDEFICISICKKKGRSIISPLPCIFPTRISASATMNDYIDFIKRQIFVFFTYSTPHQQLLNFQMVLLQYFVTNMFLIPFLSAFLQIILLVFHFFSPIQLLTPPSSITDSILDDSNLIALLVFVFTVILALFSLRFAVNVLAKMCRDLMSEEIRKVYPYEVDINYIYVLFALVTHLVMVQILTFQVCFNNKIIWSGIEYERSNGRIVSVRHLDEDIPVPSSSSTLQQLRLKSLEESIRSDLKWRKENNKKQ